MAKYPSIGVGTRVTADLLNRMLPEVVVKQSNTSRTTTTTATADPDLTIAVEANATYRIKFFVIYTCGVTSPNNGFIRTNWSVPTGTTSANRYLMGSASNQTDAISTLVQRRGAPYNSDAGYGGRTSTTFLEEEGILVTGANAGNVTLNWAQLTSVATATVVYADSYVEALRIA